MAEDRSCDLLAILQARADVLAAKCALEPKNQHLAGQLFAMETAVEDARADLARQIVGPRELIPS